MKDTVKKHFTIKRQFYFVLSLVSLTVNLSLFPKGYMALKSDLGYEFEHQRPQISNLRTMDMAQRTTIQNYRIDSGDHLSIPSGSGATDENHDPLLYRAAPVDDEEWNDIDAQTLYEVDDPYKHAAG